VPFIVRWPGRVTPGVSDALVCLMDCPASFAALTGQKIPPGEARDSVNVLPALLGDSRLGREKLVEHDGFQMLGFRDGPWKFVEPDPRPRSKHPGTGELYNLATDLGETNDLQSAQPDTSRKLSSELDAAQKGGRFGRPSTRE
jgi:arylsulfatase A-like enzyme